MSVRPTGVTILAILEFLGGISALFGGAGIFVLGTLLEPIIMIIGVILLIMGIINFIIGWGLWTLKGWAWLLALIFGIINIILGIYPTINWISIIINLIIVLYLWQPDVKAAFGR